MTTTFDPAVYKETTRVQWEDAAEAWHRWGPFLEEWLGEATELMLDLAEVREGSRVVDIAAGAGRRSRPLAAWATAAPCSRPTSRRRSSTSPPRRRTGPGSATSRRSRWTARRSTSTPARSTPRSRGSG